MSFFLSFLSFSVSIGFSSTFFSSFLFSIIIKEEFLSASFSTIFSFIELEFELLKLCFLELEFKLLYTEFYLVEGALLDFFTPT